MLANRLHFQIPPHSEINLKLELLSVDKVSSNEKVNEIWKFLIEFLSSQSNRSQYFLESCLVDVLPFQKSKFQNFRKLNGNSDMNWLVVQAVSEKLSDNCFNLKCDSVCSLAMGDDSKNITG